MVDAYGKLILTAEWGEETWKKWHISCLNMGWSFVGWNIKSYNLLSFLGSLKLQLLHNEIFKFRGITKYFFYYFLCIVREVVVMELVDISELQYPLLLFQYWVTFIKFCYYLVKLEQNFQLKVIILECAAFIYLIWWIKLKKKWSNLYYKETWLLRIR